MARRIIPKMANRIKAPSLGHVGKAQRRIFLTQKGAMFPKPKRQPKKTKLLSMQEMLERRQISKSMKMIRQARRAAQKTQNQINRARREIARNNDLLEQARRDVQRVYGLAKSGVIETGARRKRITDLIGNAEKALQKPKPSNRQN